MQHRVGVSVENRHRKECGVAPSKSLLSTGLQGKKEKAGSHGKNIRGRERKAEGYTIYL